MNVPFLDLKAQYFSISNEINAAIQQVIESSAFAGGPFVERFEKSFAAAHEAAHCVAVSSGTAALHVVMMALGIGPGDEVIIPTNTFIATAEAISLTGATPVFVDCHPVSYNMDPSLLEAAITERTKGVIAVHLYGQPSPLDEISAIVRSHALWLVEDCAQAHLALYKGRPVGTTGIAGCFSFYPGKNLGAYGEGGAVTTNDQALFLKIAALRNHGSDEKYHHKYIGHNYRMDGIQGSILDVKLRYLDQWNQSRIKIADMYRKCLKDVHEVILPQQTEDVKHVYHLFVVRVPERDRLVAHLKNKGVGSGIHYPVPCHLQTAYAFLGYREGMLPVSEGYASRLLSLPMFAEMNKESVEYVSEQIRTFYQT